MSELISPWRRRAVVLLLVAGGVLAAGGAVAGHVTDRVLDGAHFADGVDEVRRDPAVAELVGTEMSRQVIVANPDLGALRPLVDQVAVRVAGSDLLSRPTRAAARVVHSAILDGDDHHLVLRIADAGAVVAAVVGALDPDSAPTTTSVSVTLARVGDGPISEAAVRAARWAGLFAWLLPLLAVGAWGAAVGLSRDRWGALTRVGYAVAGAAAGLAAVLVVGGYAVRRLPDDVIGPAVMRAAWGPFVRPLWWSVLVLALVGVAVVVACGSTAAEAFAQRAAMLRDALVATPRTTAGRLGRAALLAVVGVAALVDPLGVVELAIVAVGVLCLLTAVVEVARVVEPYRVAAEARRSAAATGTAGTGPARERRVGVAAMAVVVLVVGVLVVVRSTSTSEVVLADGNPDSATGEGCNGHDELCDRRFDEVSYAASHNAMAVLSEPGWFIAEHADPIPVQLDQGVRALLIDVWAGHAVEGSSIVRTSASGYEEALAQVEAELGPEVVAAALRLAESIAGAASGPEQRYLCHGLCEIGSTPFVPMLEELAAWLDAHPREVVTLFIEDHVPAVQVAADVEAAGLQRLVATPPPIGEDWPTLGEMIEADERLVVMLEDGRGGDAAPWLVNGFERTQETHYTVPTVDDFSCAPNRGPADAPLFLLNHWLSGFSAIASNAVLVNDADVLLTRAQECREVRGQIPNFVAVNYVDRGDLFAVVDELNGVE